MKYASFYDMYFLVYRSEGFYFICHDDVRKYFYGVYKKWYKAILLVTLVFLMLWILLELCLGIKEIHMVHVKCTLEETIRLWSITFHCYLSRTKIQKPYTMTTLLSDGQCMFPFSAFSIHWIHCINIVPKKRNDLRCTCYSASWSLHHYAVLCPEDHPEYSISIGDFVLHLPCIHPYKSLYQHYHLPNSS